MGELCIDALKVIVAASCALSQANFDGFTVSNAASVGLPLVLVLACAGFSGQTARRGPPWACHP